MVGFDLKGLFQPMSLWKIGVKFWGGKETEDGRPASLLEVRPGSS